MTTAEAEKLSAEIFDKTSKRIGDFDEIPPSLILFRKKDVVGEAMKSGMRLPIYKWVQQFDKEPGEIIAGLQPKIYEEEEIIASFFLAEGWMLRGQLDPENAPSPEVQADVAKIMAGEMKPSDSEFKVEVLMGHFETRDGHCIHRYISIVRDPADETLRSAGESHVQTDMNAKGRTVGMFKKPKETCNCPGCTAKREAKKHKGEGV